jgi:His-Xaa-Ser system radical SAM maturase HxsB
MTIVPLRMRPMPDGRALVVNDTGRFFAANEDFVDRLAASALSEADTRFLECEGHVVSHPTSLSHLNHARALAQRIDVPGLLDYLILVPTLRCNLSCSYCQVSRVAAGAVGYDWDEHTLDGVLKLIDGLATTHIKIEFQGGEPTLRPDLIRAVIARCQRFAKRSFVICTNLARLDDDVLDIISDPDVTISTSLDGDGATHQRNRTVEELAQTAFERHLALVLERYGPTKVSALPTVDPTDPPAIDGLIDSFASRGLVSIFLRPITYHGFARKRHSDARQLGEGWRSYYGMFVARLIERNWANRDAPVLEETYLSLCLRRIFRPGADRHVDLRNPNAAGFDYIVIDHDGIVYPTDEARMLARSGIVDLSMGDVHRGWEGETRQTLNQHTSNLFDPDCVRCAYQPFCGRDVIDDIARYGTTDVPRLETEFCHRHQHIFDLAFSLIYSDVPAVRHSVARWLRLPGDLPALGASHA